jgi:hypothetical protein
MKTEFFPAEIVAVRTFNVLVPYQKFAQRRGGGGQWKRVEVEERVSKRFNKVDLTFSMIQEEAELWRAVGTGVQTVRGGGVQEKPRMS